MKKLGLVGGTGPESTVEYYQAIIKRYQEKTGRSEELPEFLINSINMYKIFEFLENGQTAELVDYLAKAVTDLQKAGAEFAVLAANTPHIVFDKVQEKVGIPMLSIVEETFQASIRQKLGNMGLLGTKFTMENEFFKQPFLADGKKLIVPNSEEQAYIHEKIVEELEKGIVNSDTKKKLLEIVSLMVEREGIEGVILACTELPMILKPEDTPEIVQMDTMEIHVEGIVAAMLHAEALTSHSK